MKQAGKRPTSSCSMLTKKPSPLTALATQYGLIAASITAISGSCDWMRLFNCFAQELPTDRGALQGRRDTEKHGAMAGL